MLSCKDVMVGRYWFWRSLVSLNKRLRKFEQWVRIISFEVCCLDFRESIKICAEKLVWFCGQG
jgi:predicted metal-binding protein